MKKLLKFLIILSFSTIITVTLADNTADNTADNSADNTLVVSQLADFEGKPKKLVDYSGNGKWLVVMIWASDCEVCNKESQQYVDFHKKHNGKDATIVGVSLDGAGKKKDALAFIKRNSINFPSLIGEPDNVIKMYEELTGAEWIGTPSFMVYNPKGELIGAQAGAVPPSIIESFIERESESSTEKPSS